MNCTSNPLISRRYKCVNCELKFERKEMKKGVVCMKCSGLYATAGNRNYLQINRSRNNHARLCDHCWPFDCRC